MIMSTAIKETKQTVVVEGNRVRLSCISEALALIHNDLRFRNKLKLFWYKNDRPYQHPDKITKIGDIEFLAA